MKKPPKPKAKRTKLLHDEFVPLALYFPETQEDQGAKPAAPAKQFNFVSIIAAAVRVFANAFRRREA